MIKANIVINHSIWKKQISNPQSYINKRLKVIYKTKAKRKINHEFSILLTNSINMKKLNLKFRNKKKTTDVLSFPLKYKIQKKIYLGDIAINYEIVKKRSGNSSFAEEFDKMWVHGYLHLMGHDHKKQKDFKVMNKKEKKILKSFDY